mgnify:CR=1 FL=1
MQRLKRPTALVGMIISQCLGNQIVVLIVTDKINHCQKNACLALYAGLVPAAAEKRLPIAYRAA